MLTLMAPATVITAVRGTDTAAGTPLLISGGYPAGYGYGYAPAYYGGYTTRYAPAYVHGTAASFVPPMRTAALVTIAGIAIAGDRRSR